VSRNMTLGLNLSIALLTTVIQLSAQQTTQQTATPPENAKGATAEQANDAYIKLMRQDIRAERKKVVAANMPLTETEATKFWPLYDRYIAETVKVNDARYSLIKEYSDNYQAMTDTQANSFIQRWVTLDGDSTQLRLKYIPEFEKVISPKKTALFFQIDRRVGMMIELQLASQIPLLQP
jgi:hypothetical protein